MAGRGAPTGNKNAIRHGLRTSKLPKGCTYIVAATNEFRDTLEIAVLEARGEVTLTDAAWINSAVRWERHAQLAQKWLRDEAGQLSAADRLAYSREIARASSERDRCIKQLDLDPRQQQPAGVLGSIFSDKNFLLHDSSEEKNSGESQQGDSAEPEASPSEK